MTTVSWRAEEKLGFPEFSNVTYSGYISRDIPDDADPVEELRNVMQEVEVVMAEERQRVSDLRIEATR